MADQVCLTSMIIAAVITMTTPASVITTILITAPAVIAPFVPTHITSIIPTLFPVLKLPVVTHHGAISMPFVTWHVLALIPIIAHKEYPFTTGMVSVAVLTPVLGVPWRYPQIDGWAIVRHPFNHDGTGINYLRGRDVADINTPVEARLPNRNGYSNVSSLCRHHNQCRKQS